MAFKRRQNLEPDCSKCNRPKLLPENNIIEYIMYKYGRLTVDGDGGISASGLDFIMKIEQIPLEEQPLLVQKLLVYINTALKVQQKEKVE